MIQQLIVCRFVFDCIGMIGCGEGFGELPTTAKTRIRLIDRVEPQNQTQGALNVCFQQFTSADHV